jgi:hypothetical protein
MGAIFGFGRTLDKSACAANKQPSGCATKGLCDFEKGNKNA